MIARSWEISMNIMHNVGAVQLNDLFQFSSDVSYIYIYIYICHMNIIELMNTDKI